ncbi:N-acetylated-alpha-linked acidic dipeptidase [Luteibacter rhizovicinus]|uniref:N-acetylated-alpha-linked acidic dipeptidase n=1 Tax=Luteibacter rhizovicinus TaxID=242606 RepID=A0A4R3YTV1_9GAMM|nr:transferrin receptor-like dimerization domain-containing protein [Luteibacter rhizovicinus]TCV95862.1 N-acetylated-alpha-linked acidic dipeptidase [Luteibacter rhizovicinus]
MIRSFHPSRSIAATAILLLTAITAWAQESTQVSPPYGFIGAHGEQQRALERRVDAGIESADLDGWLKRLTSAPNHIGSIHNKENADYIASQFRQFGWDTRVETFRVLVAYPDRQKFELLGEHPYAANFTEPAVEGDPDTTQRKDVLPGMEAYSADGDVSAPLIYVNQGLTADYDELARTGLDVKGKIVLVRSSGAGRWVKPRLAEKHGAVGIVIFSDPGEDGYVKGDVYPQGAWRTPRTIQRGTLGIDDTLDARAGARIQAQKKLPGQSIPVVTIGYGDAEVFLRALGGPQVPSRWQGGLPFAYHIGGSGARAHLAVTSDWHWETLYNVIATLRGSDEPDQWVLRGVHHDAWVFGAWDPLAGTTAMLAEAKAIGELYRQGVKPRRTLVFASWDGEELGILGSRAWTDKHADELRRKAVFYLNNDTTSRGFLSAAGAPALARLIGGVAADVRDPETGASVENRLRAKLAVASGEGKGPDPANDLPLSPLGTGSDFVAFTHHLGIPSLHVRYGYDRDGDEQSVPVYHSLYDSYTHYQRFGDPGLKYIDALAKTDARVVLRVANADLLPWRYTDQANVLGKDIDALQAYNRKLGEQARKHNALLDSHAYALAAVSWRGQTEPGRLEDDVPVIDLSALRDAQRRFADSAQAYDRAYASYEDTGTSAGTKTLRRANDALRQVEPALLGEGLSGRPWYRHLLAAPSLKEGYEVSTLPAIRDALDQRKWSDARTAVTRTAQAVEEASRRLAAATDALRPDTR